jgi:hypothetical protein
MTGDTPPLSRNQRVPTAADTPAATPRAARGASAAHVDELRDGPREPVGTGSSRLLRLPRVASLNGARADRIDVMVFAADLGMSTTFGFIRAGWF